MSPPHAKERQISLMSGCENIPLWKGIYMKTAPQFFCVGTFQLLSPKTWFMDMIYNENNTLIICWWCWILSRISTCSLTHSCFIIRSVLTRTKWDLTAHACVQSAFFLVWGLVTWDAVKAKRKTSHLITKCNKCGGICFMHNNLQGLTACSDYLSTAATGGGVKF